MRTYFLEADSGSQYRRGTIMGLTVAEAFMLVAFVLLMLLLLWRHQIQNDIELTSQLSSEVKKALAEDSAQRDLVEAAASLEPDALEAMIDLAGKPERLSDYERWASQPEVSEQRELVEAISGLEPDAMQEIADLARDPESLSELKERAALLEDAAQRELAEATTDLDPEALRTLTDLARNAESVSAFAQLAERDLDEVFEAVEVLDELGANLEQGSESPLDIMRELETLRRQLNAFDSRLAEDASARKDFIENVRRELLAAVEEAGGTIDTLGRIIFPETVFFEQGQADIPSTYKALLDNVCNLWLQTLRDSTDRIDVDEIRIEGHSSPEWSSALSERDAWERNLELSQRRAQSVLVHCLDHVADSSIGQWARSKLTAVGYSSSRPVISDGEEDFRASRRVVLGHAFSREQLISDLGGRL